jgi:hypothetical protein
MWAHGYLKYILYIRKGADKSLAFHIFLFAAQPKEFFLDGSFFFKLVGWDFWYCGHYWPIVPAPDDR